MLLFSIYKPVAVDPQPFTAFWAERYDDPAEKLYEEAIMPPFTPETVRQLFRWKNGGKLSARKLRSVEENYIARLDVLDTVDPDVSAIDFLEVFPTGGAIWRIFWLHCWQPDRYPIYDMHVHRAMTYLESGAGEELGDMSDSRKIDLYLQRYLPFHRRFVGCSPRVVDRALWTFGKFIRDWPF